MPWGEQTIPVCRTVATVKTRVLGSAIVVSDRTYKLVQRVAGGGQSLSMAPPRFGVDTLVTGERFLNRPIISAAREAGLHFMLQVTLCHWAVVLAH